MVAVRPAASLTVSVIVPRSVSRIVNDVVGDDVTVSGFAAVQLRSHVYDTMEPVEALASRLSIGQHTTLKTKLAVGNGDCTVTVTHWNVVPLVVSRVSAARLNLSLPCHRGPKGPHDICLLTRPPDWLSSPR